MGTMTFQRLTSRAVVVLESMVDDARRALRGLRLRKSFSGAIVLTLGLGIGAVCLTFSVVDSVLLQPLDMPSANQLIWIGWQSANAEAPTGPSLRDLSAWSLGVGAVRSIAGYAEQTVDVSTSADLRQLPAALVSGTFFQILRCAPQQGRWILPDDDLPGASLSVVISDGAWSELFERDPHVVGRSLRIDGVESIVIGVMPQNFAFPSNRVALWLPISAKVENRQGALTRHMEGGIARVVHKEDYSSIAEELSRVSERTRGATSFSGTVPAVRVIGLRRVVIGDVTATLALLFGASMLVLVVTCVNAASLLIARELGRRNEIVLARALGASLARIIRQLTIESFLLSTMGAVLGMAVAFEGLPLIRRLGSELIPRATDIGIHVDVLVFAVAIVFLTTICVVAVAASATSGVDPAAALKLQAAGLSPSRGLRRAREVVVASQLAISLVILAAAGVLGKSVALLLGGAPGLSTDHVLTTLVQRPLDDWLENKQPMRQFGQEMVRRLDAVPGVRIAAIGLDLPTADYVRGWMRRADGSETEADTTNVVFQVATGSYFATFGIPVLQGRAFDARDENARPPTLALSQTVARSLFGSESAVGKQVFARSNDEDAGNVDSVYQIVGVVGDIRPPGPSRITIPHVYIPFERLPVPHMTVFVRSTLPPRIANTSVRHAIRLLDEGHVPPDVRSLDDVLAQSAARPKFYLLLLSAFSIVSLLVTVLGVYGVTSFGLRQRNRELGIRIALGASRRDILMLVLRGNFRSIAIGTAAGLLAAASSTKLLVGLIAGVSPTDPIVFLAVASIILVAALMATLIPAFYAGKIDPMIALRADA